MTLSSITKVKLANIHIPKPYEATSLFLTLFYVLFIFPVISSFLPYASSFLIFPVNKTTTNQYQTLQKCSLLSIGVGFVVCLFPNLFASAFPQLTFIPQHWMFFLCTYLHVCILYCYIMCIINILCP